MRPMTKLVILTTLAVLVTTPAGAECQFKFQCSTFKSTSKPVPIYEGNSLRVIGRIYDPGGNKNLQILAPLSPIIKFQIEKRTGAILDKRGRRKVGSIESLR